MGFTLIAFLVSSPMTDPHQMGQGAGSLGPFAFQFTIVFLVSFRATLGGSAEDACK